MPMWRRQHSNWITYNCRTRHWRETGNCRFSCNPKPRKCCPLWWPVLERKQSLGPKCPFTSTRHSLSSETILFPAFTRFIIHRQYSLMFLYFNYLYYLSLLVCTHSSKLIYSSSIFTYVCSFFQTYLFTMLIYIIFNHLFRQY